MNDIRRCVSSGSPFEGLIGFSRAVRAGDHIAVSGTAPIGPDGVTAGKGDAYLQSRRCLEIIGQSLEQLGASLEDGVRTRVYLVDMDDLAKVAQSHSEAFVEMAPASTFIKVNGFIDPDWRVEIEADAIVDRESG